MKTFRPSDNGSPRNQNLTLLIAAIVVILSMIIGAWTMAALAISTYASPSTERISTHTISDDITEARKEALKQAKEERERAAKERKHALKQAKAERERAAKERKFALKQAQMEREMALKQAKAERELAAKERKHALKQAQMEREMARKQNEIERKHIVIERKQARKDKKKKTARQTIYKPVKPFKGISIGNNIMVVFTQGEAIKVAEMTGDAAELGQIEFSYDKGTLHIDYRKRHDDLQSRTVIYLTNPDLCNVSLHDASALTVQGNLKISSLKITTKEASTVNIPSVSGSNLNIKAKDASKVTILSTEVNSIEVKAGEASKVKLKGICCHSITSCANDAAGITITGRCNKKNMDSNDLGKVNDSGLIVESQRVDCNPSSSKRKMPRKP